jgi:N-acetylmuramoyl-L-alanine amidase
MKWRFSWLLGLVLAGGCTQTGLRVDETHKATGQDSRVQYIVLHYTSADFPTSLATLTQGPVSSHYLIGNNPATVYRLVDEHRRAWHAGESYWQGRSWLNSSSIGIELVNPGYTQGPQGKLWYPFSDAQIDQLIVLLKEIMARHQLKPGAIIGHSDIAPQRKVDPGPLFPWRRLAAAGLVPWPEAGAVSQWQQRFSLQPPAILWYQDALARVGFRVPMTGVLDKETRNVIAAFQMHYRPARFDGEPDAETAALLAVVSAMTTTP